MSASNSYTTKDLIEMIEDRGLYETVSTAAATGKIRALRDDLLRALRSSPPPEHGAGKWLAFDVGCIECGEESKVIGTYATKEQAEAACEKEAEEQEKNWTGQHSMEVFELPIPTATHGEGTK